MRQQKNLLLSVLPVCLLTGLFLFLSFWRVRVGLTRFFDVDEFTYIHWAGNIARGEVPYRDFFLFITPGFFWVFSLAVKLAGIGPQVFVAGRMVTLAIFFATCGLVAFLFGETRSWRWAVLAAAIFAFLPMPYDKFLEIRPDNLATLLAFAGLVLEAGILTRNIRRVLPRQTSSAGSTSWSLVGFLYASSLLILPKTLPFAATGGLVVVLFSFFRSPRLRRENWKELIYFCFGFFIPFLLFFLWLVATGTVPTAWYSITRLPFEAYFSTPWAPMEPNLFFYPNVAFYGAPAQPGGISLGLVVNHALWILGIFVGVFRLVTPFITAQKKITSVWAELLLAGVFVLSVIGYVKFFPLRHSQYLIPISLFIAYWAADGLSVFFDWLAAIGGNESLVIVIVGFVYLLAVTTDQIQTPKLLATNTRQLESIDRLVATVPLTSKVLDFEGRMLFWPDAYYICCLAFETFVPYMSHPPEPLTGVLERDKIPYIFVGDSGRLVTLNQTDYLYMTTHYAPAPGWQEQLWKRK